MRPSRHVAAFVTLFWFALQWTLPFARMRPGQSPPFPARYAWSMFAGPLTSRCEHSLSYATRSGESLPLPLPPPGSPAHTLLSARTREEFSRASQDLIAYADSDEELALALDELLTRYARLIDPDRRHTLTSVLRCDSPGARAFSRTLSLPR